MTQCPVCSAPCIAYARETDNIGQHILEDQIISPYLRNFLGILEKISTKAFTSILSLGDLKEAASVTILKAGSLPKMTFWTLLRPR